MTSAITIFPGGRHFLVDAQLPLEALGRWIRGLARPSCDLNTARCRFCTLMGCLGGRKRSRLISGWFGLGSGLELWSPIVVS